MIKQSKTELFWWWEEQIADYKAAVLDSLQTEESRNANVIYELQVFAKIPKIVKWEVQKKVVLFEDVYDIEPTIKKIATASKVRELTDYFEKLKASTKKEVFYYVRMLEGTVNVSRGIRLSDIDGKNYAFSAEALEEEAKAKKKEYEEKYQPREGYTPCKYCGKQVPNDKLVRRTIIGRSLRMVFNAWKGRFENKAVVTKEECVFCSGACACNEQMSREG